jgi:hypothetical protein
MKPSQIIKLIVTLAVICITTIFFLRGSSATSKRIAVSEPKVEFRWGEGTEFSMPNAATQK